MSAVFAAVGAWCLAHPEEIVGFVIAILTMLKGKPWVDAKVGGARMSHMMQLAHVAFHAVEEAAKLAPGQLDGAAKLSMFLDKLDGALVASGASPLSVAERVVATDMAAALNARPMPAPAP